MVIKLKLDLLLLVISVLCRFHYATIGSLRQEKNAYCVRLVPGSKNVHQNKKDRLLEFSRMECSKRKQNIAE